MKTRRDVRWRVFGITLALVLAGCTSTAGDQDDTSTTGDSQDGQQVESTVDGVDGSNESWPEFLALATGGTGGSWYAAGGAQAELWTDEVEGVSVTSESTAGGVENMQLIQTGQAHLAWGPVEAAVASMNGDGRFEDSGPNEKLAVFGPGYNSFVHLVVRADSEIQGPSELEGRTVASGGPASALRSQMTEWLAALGYGEDPWASIREEPLTMGDSIEAIRDRRIDVGVVTAGPPVPPVSELAQTTPIRLLEFSDEEIEAITAELPSYVGGILPGGTYPGVDEDVQTLVVPAGMFVSSDLPDDLVYALAEVLYGPVGTEYMIPVHPNWGLVVQDDVVGLGEAIPLHPGAQRYWEDQGFSFSE